MAEVRCAVIAAFVIGSRSTAVAIRYANQPANPLNTSRTQPREKLLVDIVEPAVAENHDHVF